MCTILSHLKSKNKSIHFKSEFIWSHNHQRELSRLIAAGTLRDRGQGQPNGRWPWGRRILSRLTFSPPGSRWKSRRGLVSSVLSRWGPGEPEMPNRHPQRCSIHTAHQLMRRCWQVSGGTNFCGLGFLVHGNVFFKLTLDFKALMRSKRHVTSTVR